jgi:hypothetical protein
MRDSGLQVERTRLAWRRSLLALVAVLALVGRPVVLGQNAVAAIAFGSAAVVALGLVVAYRRRSRAVESAMRDGRPLPGAGVPAAFVVTCVWCAIVAVVALLTM